MGDDLWLPYLDHASSSDSEAIADFYKEHPYYEVTLFNRQNDHHAVHFRGIETLIHDSNGLVSELSLLYELQQLEQNQSECNVGKITPELASLADTLIMTSGSQEFELRHKVDPEIIRNCELISLSIYYFAHNQLVKEENMIAQLTFMDDFSLLRVEDNRVDDLS